jgi:hypothetical protein
MVDISCSEIYGVDLDKKITPVIVRDAIIICFYEAHSKDLDMMRNQLNFNSNSDFEDFKKKDVIALIKLKFDEVGGDFNNPSKESLIKVVNQLKDYSKLFRDQSIIEKHAYEIMKLIEKLD